MIWRSVPFTTILIKLPALLLCVLVASCSSVKHSFRYQMKQGATYRYAITHAWHNSSVTRGKTTAAAISGSVWISLTIDSIRKDGEFVCTGKVDSANLSFGSAFGEDTSGIQKYTGKRVRMIVSPIGKTHSIVPIDSVPPEKTKHAYDQFGPLQLLPTVFVALPEQPLGIGDSWEIPLEHSARFDSINSAIHGATKYRLEGTERIGSHECIRFALEARVSGHTAGLTGLRRESGSEWSANTNGVAYFALQEGILISVEVTSRTKAASTVKQLQWSTEGTLTRRVGLLE